MGSGKDTAASIIQELMPGASWEVKKFAGKLKQIASILTGIPVEKFEDQDFKQTFLTHEWDLLRMSGSRHDGFLGGTPIKVPMTVRQFMQKLGTESLRNGLHENVWVNALFSDYKPEYNWIITDLRFSNELDAVKYHNAVTIKINRNSVNTSEMNHISETSLDHINDWDYVIENNGTLDELRNSLRVVLKDKRILKGN